MYVCIRMRANEQNFHLVKISRKKLDFVQFSSWTPARENWTSQMTTILNLQEFLVPVGLQGLADDPRVGRNAYREWQRRAGRSSRNKNVGIKNWQLPQEVPQAQGYARVCVVLALRKTSVSQSVTHSLTHSLSQSDSQSVSQSVSHSVCQSVSQSDSHSVSQSVSQSATQSLSHSVRQSLSLSVSQTATQSVSQSISHTVKYWVNESVCQIFSQSVSQSVSR